MDKVLKATQVKLRFQGKTGTWSMEDLWSISLPVLDDLATGLDKEIDAQKGASYLPNQPAGKSGAKKHLKLSRDVAVLILKERLAEAGRLADAESRRVAREELMALLEKKDKEVLGELDRDELLAKIKALG